MLQDVEWAGLFLVPLDEVRGWCRCHRMFADLLHARLKEELPGRVPALHRAAATWSEEHDLADDAVRHALVAGGRSPRTRPGPDPPTPPPILPGGAMWVVDRTPAHGG
jgi:ATP/maltotriose-dependent transcriptional regulator MalT